MQHRTTNKLEKTTNSSTSHSSSSTDEYQLKGGAIAEGSYGTVFLATDSKGEPCIVKEIDGLFEHSIKAIRILREIKILKRLKGHPNIVRLKHIKLPTESINTYNSLSLVFEKMDTDFAKIFRSNQTVTGPHNEYFLFQLLCGVRYFHSVGIVHRDLKPENILINANCDLKICDFNLSRETNSPLLTPRVVTRGYRAPEIIMQGAGNYGLPVDMWSIGCIFAQMLMMQTQLEDRDPLFRGDSCFPLSCENGQKSRLPLDQLNVIFGCLGAPTDEDLASILPDETTREYLKTLPQRKPPDLETLFPYIENKKAIDLLKRFLVINPNKRITAKEALEHSFLDSFRNDNEKLTFPLSSLSDSDRESFDEYQRFEILLEKQKQYGYAADRGDIRRLIWDEMKQYNPSSQNNSSKETDDKIESKTILSTSTFSVEEQHTTKIDKLVENNTQSKEEKILTDKCVAEDKDSKLPTGLPKTNRQIHNFFNSHGYFSNNQALRKESFHKACTGNRTEYRGFAQKVSRSFK